MLGKKPIYTAGFGVFVLGSFLCGLAPSVSWLIAFRVLQAVGATMLLALGRGHLDRSLPTLRARSGTGVEWRHRLRRHRRRPDGGGLLIDALSWRWIFMVNVPIGVLGTLVAARYVPDVRPAGGQRLDYLGDHLLPVVAGPPPGLTLGQAVGFTQPPTLVLFAGWLVFLAAFAGHRSALAAEPMIDLALFRNPRLRLDLATGALTFVAISGMFVLMPFYLQNVLGYETGWLACCWRPCPLASA